MTGEADTLARIEKHLEALVALAIDQHLRAHPQLGTPKAPRIEHILFSVGLSAAEIGALLGKSRQAVSKNLGREESLV